MKCTFPFKNETNPLPLHYLVLLAQPPSPTPIFPPLAQTVLYRPHQPIGLVHPYTLPTLICPLTPITPYLHRHQPLLLNPYLRLLPLSPISRTQCPYAAQLAFLTPHHTLLTIIVTLLLIFPLHHLRLAHILYSLLLISHGCLPLIVTSFCLSPLSLSLVIMRKLAPSHAGSKP